LNCRKRGFEQKKTLKLQNKKSLKQKQKKNESQLIILMSLAKNPETEFDVKLRSSWDADLKEINKLRILCFKFDPQNCLILESQQIVSSAKQYC
jgi:hypothetical protein